MRIEGSQDFFLLPVKNYMPDINIKDSEDRDLIILSDREFEVLTDNKIKMEDIIKEYLKKLKQDLEPAHFKLMQNYRVIAVLFNNPRQEKDDYYERIKVSWTERIENRKRRRITDISEYVEIPIYIPRYGFDHGSTSSIYFSFKTSSKYKILENIDFKDLRLRKNPDYKTILEDERHKIYRFNESPSPQLIEIIIRVGLPSTINNWIHIGFLAIIIVPSIIVIFTVVFREIPEFAFETFVGMIGFLVGLRVLIFHDLELMGRWNKVFFIGIIACVILLFSYIFISFDEYSKLLK